MNRTKEWTPMDYDHAMRLVELPLGQSPWLGLYTAALHRVVMQKPARITELGCGTGRFAQLLQLCGFKDYVGYDFSSTRIELAKKDCPGMRCLLGDMYSLFFADPGALYVMLEFLEHVEGDIEILHQLPKGATVLASVPNYGGEGSGHVRRFPSRDVLRARYQAPLDISRIEQIPLNEDKCFYLFQGVVQ